MHHGHVARTGGQTIHGTRLTHPFVAVEGLNTETSTLQEEHPLVCTLGRGRTADVVPCRTAVEALRGVGVHDILIK